MPVQTTVKQDVYFPDGTKVEVSEDGLSFSDAGVIMSTVTNTLTYTENRVQTANAGDLDVQLSNFKIDGGFTLGNLNKSVISIMGGGLFTLETTAGTPTSTIDNQVIPTGQTESKLLNLLPIDSSVAIKFSAAPVITSVTGSVDGALAANDDYYIHPDPNSQSGYSISFHTSGTILTTMAQTFTIVFGTNTPIASETLYAGQSTKVLTAYHLRMTHTDDNGKIRRVSMSAVDGTSGGFQFNFKGSNEDGIEEMPITYQAKLDTSLDSGKQLLAWHVDVGAA